MKNVISSLPDLTPSLTKHINTKHINEYLNCRGLTKHINTKHLNTKHINGKTILTVFLKLSLVVFLTVLFLTGCASMGKQNESQRFRAFSDRMFDKRVMDSPEYQTYMGIKKDYDRLNDISDEKSRQSYERSKEYLKELKTFDFAKLNETEKISYTLLKDSLEKGITGFKFRFHNYPISQMFGMHTSQPSFMMNVHQIKSLSDAKAYISRLKDFKRKFSQLIVGLELRQMMGIVPPKFVFSKVIESSQNVITGQPFNNAENDKGDGESGEKLSPLLADFKSKVEKLKIRSSQKQRLIEQAKQALLESVKPAYKDLIVFLKEQKKIATKSAGVWKFPQGDIFYRRRLEDMTTTKMNAQEIYDLGLREVRRLHKEMRKIAKKTGFKGNLKAFFKYMQKRKESYFPNTKEGREAYIEKSRTIVNQMKEQLPKLFTLFPKAKLEIKAVEPYREKSAGLAFYQGPSPDSSRPGIYYVNLYDVSQAPKHELEALAYHEAIPGHHMQIAINSELKELPKFRKYGGRYTAYTEGWALYAESLPKDVGFYKDIYSEFGRLSFQLLRATRLVVDTGLHYKKWSRQKAINYLVANSPWPYPAAVKAVERYIVMPGQATAYKVGELKIMELKQKAKKALGDRFDIRHFHDEVLRHGSVPLNILEEIIDKWISSVKSGTEKPEMKRKV